MYRINKHITGLTSIARFYLGTALLTLILWIVSFQQIENIFTETERLYQHPYKVSNASLSVQFYIQKMHQIMKDIKHAQNNEQIKISLARVSKHESEVLSQLTLISQRYLGKKEAIDNIYQLIINWRVIRQDIFDLHLKKIYGVEFNQVELRYAEQQSNKQVTELQNKIMQIVGFSNNKAKVFSENAKSNFSVIEKLGFIFLFFILSIQLLLFKMFKKDSIKEKIK